MNRAQRVGEWRTEINNGWFAGGVWCHFRLGPYFTRANASIGGEWQVHSSSPPWPINCLTIDQFFWSFCAECARERAYVVPFHFFFESIWIFNNKFLLCSIVCDAKPFEWWNIVGELLCECFIGVSIWSANGASGSEQGRECGWKKWPLWGHLLAWWFIKKNEQKTQTCTAHTNTHARKTFRTASDKLAWSLCPWWVDCWPFGNWFSPYQLNSITQIGCLNIISFECTRAHTPDSTPTFCRCCFQRQWATHTHTQIDCRSYL